jgi:hypothetical protein
VVKLHRPTRLDLEMKADARRNPGKACIAPGWSATAKAITASTVIICTTACAPRSALANDAPNA